MSQEKNSNINGFELTAFFNSILRNSSIACILILDKNGIILEMSKGIKQTFGYSPEELIGTNFERLFSKEDKDRNIPQKELEFAHKNGSALDNNYLVHKNGQYIWCQGESILINVNESDEKYFFVKFVYDINQQKLLENSLKISKRFFEGIIETIKEALLVLDKNFRIVRANAAFKETFNIKRNLTGKSFYGISGKSWNIPALKNLLEKILPENTSVKDFKIEFEFPEGNRIFCINARQLLIEGEKQEKIVIAFQDITDQENAKYKLNEKNQLLLEANKDLDVFVYTASHDLKSPINNIEALVNLIEEHEECGSKLKEILNKLKESIAKFKKTLSDLSTTAKTKSQDKSQAGKTEIKPVLEDVMYDLQNNIRESAAKITTDFSNAPAINFSKKNLRSILYNLLSNSIKYRHPEKTPEINITTGKSNGYILLKVSDNGTGFHPEDLERIGDLYQRFHKNIEGTGVGLSIVKSLIENNGGKMEVKTKEGEGTTFFIYLKQ